MLRVPQDDEFTILEDYCWWHHMSIWKVGILCQTQKCSIAVRGCAQNMKGFLCTDGPTEIDNGSMRDSEWADVIKKWSTWLVLMGGTWVCFYAVSQGWGFLDLVGFKNLPPSPPHHCVVQKNVLYFPPTSAHTHLLRIFWNLSISHLTAGMVLNIRSISPWLAALLFSMWSRCCQYLSFWSWSFLLKLTKAQKMWCFFSTCIVFHQTWFCHKILSFVFAEFLPVQKKNCKNVSTYFWSIFWVLMIPITITIY